MDIIEKVFLSIAAGCVALFILSIGYGIGRAEILDEALKHNVVIHELNPKTGRPMLKWHEFKEEVKNND